MNRYGLILILAAGLLGGCGGGADSGTADAPKLEMRVYDVPPEQTEMLSRTLSSVFAGDGKTALGKVSSPAPGRLVVLAPANLHGSIEASLRALTKDQPPKEAPAKVAGPLRLSFWSVDAVPENGADDPALAGLAPALEEARKQLGIVHFELRDHVTGVSSLGQSVQRNWTGTGPAGTAPPRQLGYTIRPDGGAWSVNLDYRDSIAVVRTRNGIADASFAETGAQTTTAIAPGQTLVVTQNPVPDSDGAATITRLYLVRVDVVPAT